jgi:hypothetical protein
MWEGVVNFCNRFIGGVMILLATVALLAVGCGKESDRGGQAAKNKEEKKNASEGNKEHDHSGWWCEEHGVPESLCSLCNNELAAKFKREGDWCKLHDRAKSQCFKCEPKLYEKYAAMYQAKFGKSPPRPPESEFQN